MIIEESLRLSFSSGDVHKYLSPPLRNRLIREPAQTNVSGVEVLLIVFNATLKVSIALPHEPLVTI